MIQNTSQYMSMSPMDLSTCKDPVAVLDVGLISLREEGRDALRRLSIKDIIEGIAVTCSRWLHSSYPYRRAVVDRVVEETGMSPEIVEHSINVELRNYSKKDITNALNAELGDHRCLDDFQLNSVTGISCLATGPDLILHWFSSSIPALPALGLIRGLLLKSPAIGRVSRREQAFAPAFVASLTETLPEVEKAVWLVTWPPSMTELLDVLATHVNAAIVYGNSETCLGLRQALGSKLDIVTHGHKVGITLIGREALTPSTSRTLAKECAYDIIAFDQRACISPQVYLVEKNGRISPREFAQALSDALREFEDVFPPASVSLDERVASHLAVQEAVFRGAEEIKAGEATILLEQGIERAAPTGGLRMVRIVEIDDLEEDLPRIGFQDALQNVAIAVASHRRRQIFHLLASLGASRICRPGAMPHPSVKWHHDGVACLSRLVCWTDIEML